MSGLVDDRPVFLSTLTATRGQSRLALAVTGASAALFVLMVPFAKQPLAPVWAFIPVYESALVISDLITAALLFGQFAILRSRALLVLASGYLFTACIAVVHAMTFPGLFAPSGLLGAGPQTTAWLYMFWHAGFPLAVLGYVVQLRRPPETASWHGRVASAVLGCVALVLLLTVGCGLVATIGREALPSIMQGSHYTPAMIFVVGSIWLLSAVMLVALWRRRPRTVLDLWLMVVMCAWLFDIGLSAVFNAGRFDLGFYAGRVYGLLAANFVLLVLMLENGLLYAGLVEAHSRERQKTADLQQLNAKLDDSNQQLEKASRFKSEFLANMAHELRTPLNGVIGFSELLKDERAGRLLDKQKRFATLIFDSGHHLLSLINDILDLSKVEAGKMSLDLDPVEPNGFLRECLALFDEAVERRGIRLHFDAMPPQGRLMVDPRKLRQIVYNLLSNAVKFTPDGGEIRLSVRVAPRSAPWRAAPPGTAARVLPLPEDASGAPLLEILIIDSGAGMHSEDLPRLFEAFQQVPSADQAHHMGTGLGLALVSRFAALHGGTVGVASAPGRGTQFGVWLPWHDGDGAAPPMPVPQATPTSPGAPNTRHALVIEDDAEAAELLRLHLESAGFQVRVLTDSNLIHQSVGPKPDLITLDILMPGTSGWEVLEQLKKDEALASVPVVIVSMVADRQRGVALGASKVLEKPVGRQQLLDAVEALGLTRQPGQTRKVLVVDDNPLAVDLVASSLAGADCEVLRAYDGEQAISLAMDSHPDLIILDLLMPGLSGFEVLDRMRSQPAMASVPILVMTAKTITHQDRERLSGRVQQVIGKQTLDRDRFMAEVGRALHQP